MRNAQDDAAQRAYNLKTQAQFDPLKYRTAQLELGQNEKIYGSDIPYHMAQAGETKAQLGNIEGQVGMGDPAAYYKYSVEHGGGQFTPNGGLRYPVMGSDGQMHYVGDEPGSIQSANRYHYGMQQDYQYQQALQREQNLSEREREFNERQLRGIPASSGSYLQLPTQQVNPAATVTPTAPSTPYAAHMGESPFNPIHSPAATGSLSTQPITRNSPAVQRGDVSIGGGSSFLSRKLSRPNLYGY